MYPALEANRGHLKFLNFAALHDPRLVSVPRRRPHVTRSRSSACAFAGPLVALPGSITSAIYLLLGQRRVSSEVAS